MPVRDNRGPVADIPPITPATATGQDLSLSPRRLGPTE